MHTFQHKQRSTTPFLRLLCLNSFCMLSLGLVVCGAWHPVCAGGAGLLLPVVVMAVGDVALVPSQQLQTGMCGREECTAC